MRPVRIVVALLAVTAFAGCERTFRDMYDDSRYKPLAPSALWPDGRSARPPPDGAVAYSEGTRAGTTSGRLGKLEPAPRPGRFDTVRPELRRGQASVAPSPPIQAPTSSAALSRGRGRFDIFCSPCHSIAGDGDGMVVRRGFPRPPSFHIERLRQAPDSHFYAVITEGYGAMHSYATRLAPADRLAVIGYIRALQLSQHAPLAALADEDRERLRAAPAADAPRPGASQ